MTETFPGGIRDTAGKRGYIATRSGDVAAVDLDTGAVLWRNSVGQPLAATANRLLTLDRDGTRFVLRLVDAATGKRRRRIGRFGMPDWPDTLPASPQTLHADATEEGEGIRVSWRMRRLYHGGAPPPPHIAAEARDESAGSIVLDPKTGRFRSLANPQVPAEQPEPLELPQNAATPDTIAVGRAGGRIYSLKSRSESGGAAEIILEARDASSDRTIWQTQIERVAGSRPPPLRQ